MVSAKCCERDLIKNLCLREEEISYDIPYMRNLKRNDIHKLPYKTERLIDLENELMDAGGKDMYTLLYLKWITNKRPTV